MRLTVIVPVYNEQRTILTVLQKVQAVGVEKEVIVIDNCSDDGTRELLRAAHLDGVRVFFNERNIGKGGSVQRGIALARGEFTIIQDADLEYEPEDYLVLLEAALREQAVAVFGRRQWLGDGLLTFRVGNRFLSRVFSLLYGQTVHDVATCYKLIRTRVLQRLPLVSSGFDLDFEIAARLALAGYRIREVPIRYRPRSHALGKKIRWRDGIQCLIGLCKWRFFIKILTNPPPLC
jgi:glycosyltransferase involved in cell wall biosynthesis